MPCQEHSYLADLTPAGYEAPLRFTVARNPDDPDEPWSLFSDEHVETHHTLDELLFWNLIIERRHISEALRQKILTDFGQEDP